jgi:hypothetical protein
MVNVFLGAMGKQAGFMVSRMNRSAVSLKRRIWRTLGGVESYSILISE